jgi:hypothetical protein
VDQYREGKVKRTAVSGVKENLKPCIYNQWELDGCLRAAGSDRVPFGE